MVAVADATVEPQVNRVYPMLSCQRWIPVTRLTAPIFDTAVTACGAIAGERSIHKVTAHVNRPAPVVKVVLPTEMATVACDIALSDMR